MRFFLDTNILLNDFFHRQPDFGFHRIADAAQAAQVQAHRQQVHEAMLWLSLQKEVEVWSSVAVLGRFGALLGDLIVPPDLVEEEIKYWLSNLKLAEVTHQHLEQALEAMAKADPKIDFDDYLLRQLCAGHAIEVLVTSVPKPKAFYWPVLVLPPEKLPQMQLA